MTDESSQVEKKLLFGGVSDNFNLFKEQQKSEMLAYLESKLRMIKLLRHRTFPPSRDLIEETVKVMSVPERLRDQTSLKKKSFREILTSLMTMEDSPLK